MPPVTDFSPANTRASFRGLWLMIAGVAALIIVVLALLKLQRERPVAPVEAPSAPAAAVELAAPPAPALPPPSEFAAGTRLDLLAGDGHAGLRDGPRAQARFADPYGIAVDGAGVIYISDGGDSNRIRRLRPDGQVDSLSGGVEGFRDGPLAEAAFHTPSGLAVDAQGNLFVADTGNHAIRKISPQGQVSTVAGNGQPGFRDGPAEQARFNGPLGVAVGRDGSVYVADSYNDRIRVISPAGQVRTLAGSAWPGDQDGPGAKARFDTPTALVVDDQDRVWVLDSRNDAVRLVLPDGTVSTFVRGDDEDEDELLRRPLSLTRSHDGYLYVGVLRRGALLQIAPDGRVHRLSGGPQAHLSRPAALALTPRGELLITDAASFRIHRLSWGQGEPEDASTAPRADVGPAPDLALPRTEGRWPLLPQHSWHEVVGTPGEVRGRRGGDARDHLHEGLDVKGDVGELVVAMADAKVSSPLANWAYGSNAEGLSLDRLAYIHIRVGRDMRGHLLNGRQFQLVLDAAGRPERIRVRRGTRFAAGDALGSINPMAHVHINLGTGGYHRNPLQLGFAGFSDQQPPLIEGIEVFDAAGRRLRQLEQGRLRLPADWRELQFVVDAWDQVDGNEERRRLGLHSLGYQLLHADGRPLAGFEQPRMTLDFSRLPVDDRAVKQAYAARSGVTVHGSAVTRFRYQLGVQVRDGLSSPSALLDTPLPPGDYLLRVIARDQQGNEALLRRDLALRVR
ncbi:NHL repeat-containing protein [Paucibacter sp. B51]|uniref:NHL repeat-containing protein n=1 Tax=Paucibacter sp. B51 TaxID=2993315 RepID=UPI0022EC016D|nr:NHL repeat-containing protein [Paucibacter sp. B51]